MRSRRRSWKLGPILSFCTSKYLYRKQQDLDPHQYDPDSKHCKTANLSSYEEWREQWTCPLQSRTWYSHHSSIAILYFTWVPTRSGGSSGPALSRVRPDTATTALQLYHTSPEFLRGVEGALDLPSPEWDLIQPPQLYSYNMMTKRPQKTESFLNYHT